MTINEGMRDTLYSNNVNPITFISGAGLVNFGQKTRQLTASALDRINVARLIIYLRSQLNQLAKPYLFEPNDKITRDEIRSAAETLFVHHHRHLDLPTNDWINIALKQNSMLLQEYAILEALRVPGNKIILSTNMDLFSEQIHTQSWAARWSSNTHPRNSKPTSEIRWFHESDKLDATELHLWTIEVINSGRIPEVLVVDEEFSVLTYLISSDNYTGSF
mgnify:FL=1